MSLFRPVAFAFTILLSAVAGANAATFNGSTLSVDYLYPDLATVYPDAFDTGSFVVGAGIDKVVDVEHVTDISIDFEGSSLFLVLNTVLGNPKWNDVAFNGLRFTVLSNLPKIIGFTLIGRDFEPIQTSFTDHELFVNWSDASYVDGSSAQFSVDFAPVPLPAGLPLLAAGLIALGLSRRRARQG